MAACDCCRADWELVLRIGSLRPRNRAVILVGFPDARQMIAALTKVGMRLPRHNPKAKGRPFNPTSLELTCPEAADR